MSTTVSGDRSIRTVDPSRGETLAVYEPDTPAAVDGKLAAASRAFAAWRGTGAAERAAMLPEIATRLRERKTELATLAVHEMGKTLVEAEAEVEKCATACDYYAANGPGQLADEPVETNASRSFVAFFSAAYAAVNKQCPTR